MGVRPGYKATEVGVIPVGWEVKRLREIATIATGNTPPTKDATNYGDEFLFVGPVDMGDSKSIARTEKKLSKKGFALSRRFPKDSILFVSIGSTIGKCGIAPVELTSNQQINAIFPSPDFSVDYLFYAVCTAAPKIRAQAGEQAVPIVNKTQFSETAVALPPLPEQRAIAEALSDVDALLGALDRLIAKKRDLKQAATQQLLTGQTRFPGFHGDWEVTRLADIADKRTPWSIVGGPFGSNLKASDYTDQGVRIIQLQNIGDGRFMDAYAIYTSDAKADELLSNNIYPGEIIISKMGDPVARACLVPLKDSRYLMASDGIRLVADPLAFDTRFVLEYINSPYFRQKAIEASTGSTRQRIGMEDLRRLPFVKPSLAEQRAIGEVLREMDAELAGLDKRRDKTRSLKRAMMQELLTGRTRLM